jgi:hypothetical protein
MKSCLPPSRSRGSHRRSVLAAVIGPILIVGGLGLTSASAANAVPNAPLSVSALQVGPSADITVSWSPSNSGSAATGAVVQLYSVVKNSYSLVSQIKCGASCTSAVFRDLNFGTNYIAWVTPWNVTGSGPSTYSATLAPANRCASGACVTLNATSSIGPANHADSGVLNSVFNVGNLVTDLASLDTTMYRGSPFYNEDGTLNWSDWNLAVGDGTKTELILSNLWSGFNAGNPPTPWSNWSIYNAWVKSTVKTIVASGEQVSYWDLYNEPGGFGYYSAANYAIVTPALLLQQFLDTYQDVKAVDPSAAIVGPSLAEWGDYPNQYSTNTKSDPEFDMASFLTFAATNHLQLAAISWHEIADSNGPNPEENSFFPAVIIDHVNEARRLIAALPSLGHPQIFIEEYGLPEVQQIPGWDVSYLSALTTAGVASADRACWPASQCANPTLDSLLANNAVYPEPDYWVRTAYAAMSGNMIASSSSLDWVTALGSYNATNQTITGLIGRGKGCDQDAYCDSVDPYDPPLAPISATITVTVPWRSGTVNVGLADIAGQNITPIYQPIPVTSTLKISPTGPNSGTVTIPISSFADGDAYSLTIGQ